MLPHLCVWGGGGVLGHKPKTTQALGSLEALLFPSCVTLGESLTFLFSNPLPSTWFFVRLFFLRQGFSV